MRAKTKGAVLSLGRIYCDLVFTGLASMPRLGREVFAEGLTPTLGGGAFITAAHCGALGRKAALVARFGTDPLSLTLEDRLTQPGLDLAFLERNPQAGPQVTVVMAHGEERAFLSRRAGHALPATLGAALDWSEACHLHIAEYATLNEHPGLIAEAKGRGITVSLDPSWDETLIRDPRFFERTAGVDIFLPNLEEAAALTGSEAPEACLSTLAAHFPLVALKLGPQGAMLAHQGRVFIQPALAIAVVDTTGAGDAFNAGFIDAWLDGSTPETALSAAIACGSHSVQHAGGIYPTSALAS
ncbi:carbohydrate kinase family protein [Pelagibacterium lentulum]|uniref:carbohydrate kinase family protein n=1 Tax=Pelagibacterium lentulum TaxID=2029865 RepID=UPI000F8D2D3A|nr:sugar kinase [Pelagibacterium lentulum]